MNAELRRYTDYRESGIPWIGPVPAHWEVTRLKQVSSRSALYGANIPAPKYVANGVRFLRTTDITDDGALLPGGVHVPDDLANGYMLMDGDLLISRSGTVGRSFLYHRDTHGPCSYAGYLVRFELGPRILPEFAFYFTKTTAFADFLKVSAIQSTIDNVNGEKYANSPIPLPPIHEQEAIAKFVAHSSLQIARLIRNKRRLIALLNEEKQAIIQQAVTRGLDPDVPLKPSGVEWLGDIPAHWDVKPLLRCVSELSDYRGATPEKVDEGVQLVTARNVKSGWIDYQSSQEYVRLEDYQQIMRRGLPKVGDLLMTMEAPLGNVALVDRPDIALAQRVVRMRVSPSSLIPEFALFATLAKYFQDQLQMRATGSTALGIKASKLPQLLAVVPPLVEQHEITKFLGMGLSAIDSALRSAGKEIDLIREYRTRLISDVVTGQLDVRDVQFDDDLSIENLDLGEVELLDEEDVTSEEIDEMNDEEEGVA